MGFEHKVAKSAYIVERIKNGEIRKFPIQGPVKSCVSAREME
jgi:hypothetical protein